MKIKSNGVLQRAILRRAGSAILVLCQCMFSVPVLIAGITATNRDSIPYGEWEVVQLTIEKNTDGKVETVVRDTENKVEKAETDRLSDEPSYISCPQMWDFKDSTNVVLRFPNGSEETSSYRIEGEKFSIRFQGAIHQFGYVVNGNNLTLTLTLTYRWNQPSGHLADIEEKWTVILTNPTAKAGISEQ